MVPVGRLESLSTAHSELRVNTIPLNSAWDRLPACQSVATYEIAYTICCPIAGRMPTPLPLHPTLCAQPSRTPKNVCMVCALSSKQLAMTWLHAEFRALEPILQLMNQAIQLACIGASDNWRHGSTVDRRKAVTGRSSPLEQSAFRSLSCSDHTAS